MFLIFLKYLFISLFLVLCLFSFFIVEFYCCFVLIVRCHTCQWKHIITWWIPSFLATSFLGMVLFPFIRSFFFFFRFCFFPSFYFVFVILFIYLLIFFIYFFSFILLSLLIFVVFSSFSGISGRRIRLLTV
jgi:hypothetical protein